MQESVFRHQRPEVYQSLCPMRDKEQYLEMIERLSCVHAFLSHLFWAGEAVVSVFEKKGKAEPRKNAALNGTSSGSEYYYFKKQLDDLPSLPP